MTWYLTNLFVQMIAGMIGAQIVSVIAHEHRIGLLWQSLVGLIAGAFSGYFLQTVATTMVTASGNLNEVRFGENLVIQILTGAGVGAVAALIVGLVHHSRRAD